MNPCGDGCREEYPASDEHCDILEDFDAALQWDILHLMSIVI